MERTRMLQLQSKKKNLKNNVEVKQENMNKELTAAKKKEEECAKALKDAKDKAIQGKAAAIFFQQNVQDSVNKWNSAHIESLNSTKDFKFTSEEMSDPRSKYLRIIDEVVIDFTNQGKDTAGIVYKVGGQQMEINQLI